MSATDIYVTDLQNKFLKVLNFMPTTFRDRNERARYERILKEYENYLKSRSDEIMDALTDSVKDFITPDEAKQINEKIRNVFENEVSKDLLKKLKSVENSLSPGDKISVLKKRLSDLKEEIESIRNKLLSSRWTDIEDAENNTVLSQVLYLSKTIIEKILNDIEWESKEGLKEANELLGIPLYLILKFIAMIKKKVTMESLTYAISAAQVILDYYETAPFA